MHRSILPIDGDDNRGDFELYIKIEPHPFPVEIFIHKDPGGQLYAVHADGRRTATKETIPGSVGDPAVSLLRIFG